MSSSERFGGNPDLSAQAHFAPSVAISQSAAGPPRGQPAEYSSANRPSDPDFMLSLARGLQVTRALARRKRPSTVSQLSLDTGLARSVVRRCLYTLGKIGLAGRDDRRRFFLLPDVRWHVEMSPRR